LRKHPIYRALRADKMIIAMLEAVLAHYLTANPEESIPALRMAGESADSLRQRAEALKTRLNQTLLKLNCEVVSTTSTLGGGTLPGETLPSFGIHLKGEFSPDKLARHLRTADLPIVPIVIADKLVIDLRTVPISEESLLCNSLIEIDKLLPS
jgi:L-seryl-tRNA(Ser) seleniumtransferase